MNAYTAQIIYSIECEGRFTDQYEQQWRLVYGHNETEALDEARKAGQNEEALFPDRHGRQIRWRMLAVKDIQPIEIKNGGLLFSMLYEPALIPAPVWAAS
jgi:Domain of unknown function (DUF4288)